MYILFILFLVIIFFIVFISLILFMIIITDNKKINTSLPPIKQQTNVAKNNNYKNIYEKKRYLTTLKEVEFYNIIQKIANKYNLLVFSQIVLYELINIKINKYNKEYLKYFNKISSKSIDFVIVNKKTTKILLCIELDDKTHSNEKRIQRDNFINELFKEINLPLLRISTSNKYDSNYLEEKIKEICTDLNY